jgi:hypothetical protein
LHLLIPSHEDPTSVTPVASAHAGINSFVQDSVRNTIQFTVGYYRTLDDYNANVSPIGVKSYNFTPNQETRADSVAIPSYSQVLGLAQTTADDPPGTLAILLIQRAIVTFLLTLPEFAGASVVA